LPQYIFSVCANKFLVDWALHISFFFK